MKNKIRSLVVSVLCVLIVLTSVFSIIDNCDEHIVQYHKKCEQCFCVNSVRELLKSCGIILIIHILLNRNKIKEKLEKTLNKIVQLNLVSMNIRLNE